MSKTQKISYKRNVKISDVLVYYVLTLLAYVAIWGTYSVIHIVDRYALSWWLLLVAAMLVTIILFKYHLMGLVYLYQLIAPKRLRDRCLYTPSCSNYMILSLQKYGLFKGLVMGINRIRRCHPPFGGEDYP